MREREGGRRPRRGRVGAGGREGGSEGEGEQGEGTGEGGKRFS